MYKHMEGHDALCIASDFGMVLGDFNYIYQTGFLWRDIMVFWVSHSYIDLGGEGCL